ncbi:immunity 52 family protein [Pseudomonas sp. 5P_3.1_Bac2]|uniref:immunity 52 family protein n=1 Tax=Pseudomonas sp. 5P_3.1_Bac2 TaxID=2971617 RepID=UPI0021C65D0E|nr:immunity 52 family protein [Pseudomonas sp. 5P_3.1_Bac2]MCU1717542.1 immunity 52 family protein [Pseudomonas sp. 5P_3.1_Bac2]
MTSPFRSFVFKMRFDKQAITSVSRDQQVERVHRYLSALGGLHPLLGKWYLQGSSLQEALKTEVVAEAKNLERAAATGFDTEYPTWLSLSLWNGQEDPLQGGLAFNYYAHDMPSISSIDFEDAGALVSALDDPGALLVEMLRLTVTMWPEVDWGVIAPNKYYLDGQVFSDRQTIGWIGFCPHTLKPSDFPDAKELIDIPERGTIMVNFEQVMDERNRDHFRIVGTHDTKLVELGYLPMFNN